jgi:hypothetical protein
MDHVLAFVIQVQSVAWYVKFTDRIFGRAEESGARGLAYERA